MLSNTRMYPANSMARRRTAGLAAAAVVAALSATSTDALAQSSDQMGDTSSQAADDKASAAKKTAGDQGQEPGADQQRAKASIQGDVLGSASAGYDDRKPLSALTPPGPVESARRDVAEELREIPSDKAGPFMANVKTGPGIGLGGAEATLGAQVDVGYAVVKGDGRRWSGGDLYVVASPEFHFGTDVVLTLPLGLQYDIPTPVEGFYIYPRLTGGIALVLQPGEEESGPTFNLTPGAGIKYVVNRTMNVGIEPVVVPIMIGDDVGAVQYRIFGYAGVNL